MSSADGVEKNISCRMFPQESICWGVCRRMAVYSACFETPSPSSQEKHRKPSLCAERLCLQGTTTSTTDDKDAKGGGIPESTPIVGVMIDFTQK